MKKVFLIASMLLALGLLSFFNVFSQSVPQGMNYQAVARDANGNELVSKSLTVKLAVKSKSGSVYTTQYEETHTVTTNAYGLFTLVIGQGTVTSGTFASIPWATYDMYLNVSVDDGNGYIDLGKTQLVSVPYAFVSGSTVSSSVGATGPSGAQGVTGVTGKTGPTGATGPSGADGKTGATGPSGADGSENAWGLTGNAGTTSSNFIGTTDAVDVRFKVDGSEVMRVMSGGNVGIGTTSSVTSGVYTAKLHVKTSTNDEGIFSEVTTASGTNAVGVYGSANSSSATYNKGLYGLAGNSSAATNYGTYSVAQYGTTNTGVYAYAYDGTTNYGLKGVAGSGSSSNYGVYGSYSSSTSSTSDWGLYSSGDAYAASWNVPSDEKLKTNIKPLEGALTKIMLLNPKTYEYKTEEFKGMNLPKGNQMGLLVQDVEKVFPDIVKTNIYPGEKDEDGRVIYDPVNFKCMNYIALIPLLTKAIQEQQATIDQQNELIAKLQKANNVTQANFENQHTINMEMDAKLNELYKQISALKENVKAEK